MRGLDSQSMECRLNLVSIEEETSHKAKSEAKLKKTSNYVVTFKGVFTEGQIREGRDPFLKNTPVSKFTCILSQGVAKMLEPNLNKQFRFLIRPV